MKKLYFILGFSFLTSTVFAQWTELNLEITESLSSNLNFAPKFVVLTENNEIYSLFSELQGSINVDPNYNSGQNNSSLGISYRPRLIKYDGSFISFGLFPLTKSPEFYIARENTIAQSNNVLYAASRSDYIYNNISVSNKLNVYKYNNFWEPVGSPYISSSGVVGNISLGFSSNNDPYVFYYQTNGLTVNQFDGTNWVRVGSTIPKFHHRAFPFLFKTLGDTNCF